jgi:hypothetical protein
VIARCLATEATHEDGCLCVSVSLWPNSWT